MCQFYTFSYKHGTETAVVEENNLGYRVSILGFFPKYFRNLERAQKYLMKKGFSLTR